MITPGNALWTTYDLENGAVHNATIQVTQNVYWVVERKGITLSGTYC